MDFASKIGATSNKSSSLNDHQVSKITQPSLVEQQDKVNKLMKELYSIDYNGMWYYSLHLIVCRMSQRPDKRPWVTSQRGTICQSFLFSCYWGLLDKHYIMGLIIPRILRRQKSNPLWPPQGSVPVGWHSSSCTRLGFSLFFTSILGQSTSARQRFWADDLSPTYFSFNVYCITFFVSPRDEQRPKPK